MNDFIEIIQSFTPAGKQKFHEGWKRMPDWQCFANTGAEDEKDTRAY